VQSRYGARAFVTASAKAEGASDILRRYVCDHARGPMRGQRGCAGLLAYPELDDALGVIEAIQFGRRGIILPTDRNSRLIAEWRAGEVPMNKQAKITAQMASSDKLIQDLDTRYRLGPKAGLLAQESLGLIKRQPGGIGGFVNRRYSNFIAAMSGSNQSSSGSVTETTPHSLGSCAVIRSPSQP
jgi:hypothetical protein